MRKKCSRTRRWKVWKESVGFNCSNRFPGGTGTRTRALDEFARLNARTLEMSHVASLKYADKIKARCVLSRVMSYYVICVARIAIASRLYLN